MNDPSGMPVSFQPGDAEAIPETQAAKPRPKWLIPSIAAGCAIILIVGGVVVWRTVDAKHRLETAKAACETGLSTVKSAKNAWERKLKDQTVTDASKITKDQVADAKVLTTLSGLTGTEYTKILDCTATDAAGYERITATNSTLQTKYEANASKLDPAAKAVTASANEKKLNDAKTTLAKTIASAKTLLKDSDGKVADDKTRDTLSKTIDTASKGADTVDEANRLDKTLADAISQVNASIQARKDADAKSKAEADAAAAQAQAEADAAAAQAQQSYTGYDYTYTDPTPQTTTPQTTVPQQQTQTVTPQQTAPQTTTPQATQQPAQQEHGVGTNWWNSSDADANGNVCVSGGTDGKPGTVVPCN
ncbi:colicin transporter [Bifidobacterium sp. SO1]|uniref:colicin transporter n=1 Tax=Bifidobacterium sp. SO1 TaxID=2809029 RepID=UPI001BDD68D1|nr:colicin transporter [Bifidobacterium sp. SO1]MBT1161823.1 colicin transporter [Bifidobacterium sp. SO1]